jgi:hypothetical protein
MGQRRVASPVTATTDLLAADILESEKSSPMEPDYEISSSPRRANQLRLAAEETSIKCTMTVIGLYIHMDIYMGASPAREQGISRITIGQCPGICEPIS